MMQQQMYNPYGGYSFGGYSPYMQGGGYGAFNPYYGFGNPFGGQGSMQGGFSQGMFNPYQNFFSGFEQKLNELLANYQKQFGEQTTTTPNTSTGSSTSESAGSSTSSSTPSMGTTQAAPSPVPGNTRPIGGKNFGQSFVETGNFGDKGLAQIQAAGYANVDDFLKSAAGQDLQKAQNTISTVKAPAIKINTQYGKK